MGKVTKIMLGLNILAGIAGIIFGMGIKGNLKDANDAKDKAEAQAKLATGGTSELQSKNQKLNSDLQLAQGQLASVTNELAVAKTALSSVEGDQGKLATDLQKAGNDLNEALSQLTVARKMAERASKLEQEISGYRQIGTLTQLQTLKAKSDKAAKAAKDAAKKKKNTGPKKPITGSGGEVGAIVNYDSKFGFYTVNRGADHGLKKSQEFRVLRGGKLVGKIKINNTFPTVSTADPVKAFTRQPLQVGDKVFKSE